MDGAPLASVRICPSCRIRLVYQVQRYCDGCGLNLDNATQEKADAEKKAGAAMNARAGQKESA